MRHFLVLALLLATGLAARGEEKKPCIFCEIIAGRVPATVVYRDSEVIAFLDHAPVNPGHVLVVPLQHADDLFDLPPATAEHMMRVAQLIARGIRRTDLKAEGFRLMLNSGKVAGQDVPHAHLHVIPRFRDDERRPILSPAELEPVAARIRAGLAETAGAPR